MEFYTFQIYADLMKLAVKINTRLTALVWHIMLHSFLILFDSANYLTAYVIDIFLTIWETFVTQVFLFSSLYVPLLGIGLSEAKALGSQFPLKA